MRTVVDPESGELLEVFDEQLLSDQIPYSYSDFRRANLQSTTEHREALRDLRAAEKTSAQKDAAYHRELAREVLIAKVDHGSTVAETIAKGTPAVVKAREERLAAEGEVRAAMEKVRLCRDDRAALAAMGSWSRQANADGWPPE